MFPLQGIYPEARPRATSSLPYSACSFLPSLVLFLLSFENLTTNNGLYLRMLTKSKMHGN